MRSRAASALPALTVLIALVGAHAFAAASDTVEVDVGRMSFRARAAGPPEGELVILLHGFPETSYAYRHQLAALGAAGYRAVAFDQRGYSPGARPATVEAYAMQELVGDLLGVATALGAGSFHLVGHDWGGAVAWVAAALHPARVRSLVALSTPHVTAFGAELARPGSEQSKRSAYFADFAAEGSESGFLADDAARLRAVYPPAIFSEQDVAAYLEVLGERDALRAALHWYRASAVTGRDGSTPGGSPLPPIRVPTLYVWSSADPAFAREPAERSGDYVEAPYRFEVLEGISHWVMEEAPGRVTSLLLEHLAAVSDAAANGPRVETITLDSELPSRDRLGGVAVRSDGSVYVSNFGASVWRVSPEGAGGTSIGRTISPGAEPLRHGLPAARGGQSPAGSKGHSRWRCAITR